VPAGAEPPASIDLAAGDRQQFFLVSLGATPTGAGCQPFFDKISKPLLGLFLLVTPDQITDVLAGVAVVSGCDPVVNFPSPSSGRWGVAIQVRVIDRNVASMKSNTSGCTIPSNCLRRVCEIVQPFDQAIRTSFDSALPGTSNCSSTARIVRFFITRRDAGARASESDPGAGLRCRGGSGAGPIALDHQKSATSRSSPA